MSLVLKASTEADDNYDVVHGELKVGQIYRRKAALRPEAQWLWALNGVPAGSDASALAGSTATLDEAMAALQERWSKWLASSGLTEKISEP
jgi:hypothetical protein